MNIAQALDFINSQLMANTLKTLRTLETTILKEAWKGKDSQTYEQIGDSGGFEPGSVKTAAYKLWQRLSGLCGETVNRDNVQAVVERYYNKVSIASPPVATHVFTPVPTPPAPTYTDFVGREEAIDHLQNLISQGKKIILIHAAGGVGKTTLAQEFLSAQNFELVLSLPMAKDPENITRIESVVEEWLKQYFKEEPGRDFNISLDRLKRQLKNRRVGVFIDNLEPALDANCKFIAPHSNYVELLRILAEPSVQSVTLITSRERLCEEGLTIERYKLPELSEFAWQQYFNYREIIIYESTLSAMHKALGGNAKAMTLFCGEIAKDFDGDMVAYWFEYGVDILAHTTLRNLVISQFNRLQKMDSSAYQLLCRLGCFRYQDVANVPTDGLLCLLWDVPETQQRRVLESLRDRSLVEFHKGEYWLHPMIREEAISRLKNSENWEIANRQAAEFWTKTVKVVTTVKDALTALEAYYHYLNISDFQQAAEVLNKERLSKWKRPEILGQTFWRLGILQKMCFAIESLIIYISEGVSLSKLYNVLGDVYWMTGDLHRAIHCHENSGNIVTKKNYFYKKNDQKIVRILQIRSLFNIGLCKIDLGELEDALDYFDKSLFLDQKYGYNECTLVSNFCLAFLKSCLGSKEEASSMASIIYHQLPQNNWEAWQVGYGYLFMGLTYKNLEQIEKSFEMNHAAIVFTNENNYPQVKAKALTGLAEIYRIQNDVTTALNHHFQSIEILDEIGGKCDLPEAYYQLALTCKQMGNTVDCEKYFNQAITLYQEMEAPKQIARVRQSMSIIS
ncbi:hypothetical protein QUA43_30565 [Microcoleus sp. N9_B4]|uniref:hypothetical protein n=1 Tax=Microcoleus sp. N9_B4 TaxID=3055386 RepID=UPI002FCF7E30